MLLFRIRGFQIRRFQIHRTSWLIAILLAILIGQGSPRVSWNGTSIGGAYLYAQNVAPDKKKELNRIKDLVNDAGKKFKDQDFEASAVLINQASKDIMEVLQGSDLKFQKTAEPIYQKLAKAHQLLSLEGIALEPLGDWKSILEGKVPSDGKVSFVNDLAPWMVQQCGRCHVQGTRGNFSMLSYAALMKGPPAGVVVFAKDPKGSRLVEVIESGDMPRGGGKVSPENIAKLKLWIDQGANFDGPDPSASLATLVKANGQAAPDPASMITKPTGGETVSFARQIAPLLVENCKGCHIGAQRPRGNLRLDNFTQAMRGGDGGSIVTPKKPDESLLIKKLKGMSGQRMPVGRPAFTEAQIELISTWIKEGAAFDGATPDTNIEQVAARAWADSASADEIRAKRRERSLQQWKVVAPKSIVSDVGDQEFFVMGDIGEESLKDILKEAHEAAKIVRKQLRLPENEPLLKGGLTIFVFDKRYDYGEFGKMAESRTLPPEWNGHWRKQTVDAYVVMHYDANSQARNRSLLIQLLSSVHVGALEGVPQWFADGVGRSVVSQTSAKEDPRIAQWQNNLGTVSQQLKDSKQLLEGKLGEEEAALVGFAVVRSLTDRQTRKAFDQLLKAMRGGMPFEQAFTRIYGAPEPFLKNWLGLPGK